MEIRIISNSYLYIKTKIVNEIRIISNSYLYINTKIVNGNKDNFKYLSIYINTKIVKGNIYR